jgi:hypothetical protein
MLKPIALHGHRLKVNRTEVREITDVEPYGIIAIDSFAKECT